MSKARDLANAGTALTTVSATELGYLDGVTSAVQTQIDSKIGQATAINPTIVDAKGDIIAATAADTVSRLAVGANDTVLTADSSTATGLKWAAPAGGGKVLQVVSAVYSTSTSVDSETYTDTGLTASITPSSATSKVLVLVSQFGKASGYNVEASVSMRLMRGATVVYTPYTSEPVTFGFRQENDYSSMFATSIISFQYLDSPATTSSTTYKIQVRKKSGATGYTAQPDSGNSSIILMEIGA